MGLIRDGEPRMSTSTFTQLLNSGSVPSKSGPFKTSSVKSVPPGELKVCLDLSLPSFFILCLLLYCISLLACQVRGTV